MQDRGDQFAVAQVHTDAAVHDHVTAHGGDDAGVGVAVALDAHRSMQRPRGLAKHAEIVEHSSYPVEIRLQVIRGTVSPPRLST